MIQALAEARKAEHRSFTLPEDVREFPLVPLHRDYDSLTAGSG